MSDPSMEAAGACPVPVHGSGDAVTLAHGEGARLFRKLLHDHILPHFTSPALASLGDAALLDGGPGRLAFTTDSHVVTPLFFPGGDIGTLAVCGCVNDLCVAGARPMALSLALILEEGLPIRTLTRVLASVARAAAEVEVPVVAGDTKVVPRGAADSMFLTTSGVGRVVEPPPPGPGALQSGDELIVTGPLGRHGIAVLAAREHLALDPPPCSDVAHLLPAMDALRCARIPVRCARDATRGGFAAVLHEWAAACAQSLAIDEEQVPVTPEVRGACELLGLDPVYIANEGVMVVAVPEGWAERALGALRAVPVSVSAARVGSVRSRGQVPVLVRRVSGREMSLDEPLAALLPRIC